MRLAIALILLTVPASARVSPDSEWIKQADRFRWSEFCNSVGRPPQPLIDALNQSVKADPATWGPVVEWFNKITQKYQEAGCGST